jgi:hypothetical protein
MSLELQRAGLRIALDLMESIQEPGFKERLAIQSLREVLEQSERSDISRDAAIAFVQSVGAELDRVLSGGDSR